MHSERPDLHPQPEVLSRSILTCQLPSIVRILLGYEGHIKDGHRLPVGDHRDHSMAPDTAITKGSCPLLVTHKECKYPPATSQDLDPNPLHSAPSAPSTVLPKMHLVAFACNCCLIGRDLLTLQCFSCRSLPRISQLTEGSCRSCRCHCRKGKAGNSGNANGVNGRCDEQPEL